VLRSEPISEPTQPLDAGAALLKRSERILELGLLRLELALVVLELGALLIEALRHPIEPADEFAHLGGPPLGHPHRQVTLGNGRGRPSQSPHRRHQPPLGSDCDIRDQQREGNTSDDPGDEHDAGQAARLLNLLEVERRLPRQQRGELGPQGAHPRLPGAAGLSPPRGSQVALRQGDDRLGPFGHVRADCRPDRRAVPVRRWVPRSVGLQVADEGRVAAQRFLVGLEE
jgi:hypothetical protein